MKEIKLKLIKNKEIHSEYSYTYSSDEEKKEYYLKMEDYAKKIEHEVELVSDLEIETIKNEEEVMLDRMEKIKALKSIDFSIAEKTNKLALILKDLIELL